MNNTKDVTQKHIAEDLGVSQAMVSYILNGGRKTSYSQAKKIARICQCSPSIFLEGDVPKIRKIFKEIFNYE